MPAAIFQEAFDHTVFLATETYKVVVQGDTEDKSFQSKGFTSPTELAVFAIICLCNLAFFEVVKVSSTGASVSPTRFTPSDAATDERSSNYVFRARFATSVPRLPCSTRCPRSSSRTRRT